MKFSWRDLFNPQYWKDRWLELRLGFSSYVAYVISFFNLILLISLRFGGSVGWFFYIVLLFSLSAVAVTVGHIHLKHQQETDVKLEYEYIIEETANRVIKKLKENEK